MRVSGFSQTHLPGPRIEILKNIGQEFHSSLLSQNDWRNFVGSHMVSITAWITLPFIGIATAVYAEHPKDSVIETEKDFYAAIEGTVKQEFDNAVAELKRAASTKNSSQKVYDEAF